MKVSQTTQYRHMMALLGQCGLTQRTTRLRVVSHILNRDVTTFTSLTSNDVDDIVSALSMWKMVQQERFDAGIIMQESLLYVNRMCDVNQLTISDNDVLPTQASRKQFKEYIMSHTPSFSNPTQDDMENIINQITSADKDIDVVSLDTHAGRLSSDKVIAAPTVSLGLALGVGGLPRGSVAHIYGEKHGGKTLLANHFIAEAQAAGIPAVLLDAEAAADGAFMAAVGANMDGVTILRPHDLESLCSALRKLAKSGALIVVDSIASSESSRELERNLTKDAPRVGGNANLWKSTLSIFRPDAKKYGTTLILINQIRANMNAGMMGDPHKPYGSESIQHNSDISIRVSSVKEQKDVLKKNGYKVSRMRFYKNRNNGQLDKVDITFKPGKPYDRSIDLVRCCGKTIDDGNDMTYGELSYNALIANHIFDDESGVFQPRNNRYAITIDPYMMAAIRMDEPDFEEVDIEPVEEYNGLWDEDNPAPDVDADNWTGFTLPGVGEVNAMKWLKKHPYARDLIAERFLNGLNRKNDFIKEFD